MAGFSVKKSVNTISINLNVNTFNEDMGSSETVLVTHTFKFPDLEDRAGHQSRLVQVKGKKVKSAGTQEANWWLWKRLILDVVGYDDLDKDKDGNWKNVFDTPMLRIHAENAIQALLSMIDTEEADEGKK